MSNSELKINSADAQSLTQVLDQSERIKDVMIECADDLSSVNIALKQKLANDVGALSVENALQTSQSVEEKVQDAAAQLSSVNQALGDEVVERQMLEQRLETAQTQADESRHASLHDALTGLPNRLLFYDRLEHGLAQANRHGWTLAVLFVDLDNFKIINDTLGHATGDYVLKTVAQRLKETIRNDDTFCRHGGDEFLYLLLEVGDEEHIAAITDKIMAAIEAPIAAQELTSAKIPSISASIGIAIFPKNGLTVEALIKSADQAMYQAKVAKASYAFAT
ncbi:diguanylate cyclase domain-containing protein [Undibacterium sp. Ren11W]|uniref:diguanylate cyclase domain-containing protein n=1 Tax=Undibacterium sp. Ren11W TaxID=3413045 RepID=UPI003BF0E42C